jgi:23S rRNA pseudouridine1911/1915/1917 synthase
VSDLRRFVVVPARAERLDRFLADQLSLSRTQAARLVADKQVTVNGVVARASRVLEHADDIVVTIPDVDPPRHLLPADIPLQVVWEDEHLAVIDKPAGLVVHPAPGHWDDTLVNALVARGTALGGGVAGRPGIVHRLDRDTSGLIVVAKNDLAHRRLGKALADRKVSRRYAALAWGHIDADPTIIDAPIDRHPKDRTRMAIVADGRAARTDVHVVARYASCDLVRCVLHSGRTHQIRVHLAHIGHPVVGDPVYGAGGSKRIGGPGRLAAEALERSTPRQALHAAALAFRHPISGEPLQFRSEWPADLREALQLASGEGPEVADGQRLGYIGFFKDED